MALYLVPTCSSNKFAFALNYTILKIITPTPPQLQICFIYPWGPSKQAAVTGIFLPLPRQLPSCLDMVPRIILRGMHELSQRTVVTYDIVCATAVRVYRVHDY